MNQLIIIHGGTSFETKEQFYEHLRNLTYDPYDNRKSWRNWLELTLSESFEFFSPTMPNKQWADYDAWKIWFEKIFPYLNDEKLIVIGHSLGSIFLAKYLSENKFPKLIDQLHLVSPVFDDEGDEKVASFGFDPNNLFKLNEQAKKIFLYHSIDDDIVSFSHAKKYLGYIDAKFFEFQDKGHFLQPIFLEILDVINQNLE